MKLFILVISKEKIRLQIESQSFSATIANNWVKMELNYLDEKAKVFTLYACSSRSHKKYERFLKNAYVIV